MDAVPSELFSFLPDMGATVVFIVFMYLWHRRTMARDEQFHKSIEMFSEALRDCQKGRLKAEKRDT